jgi:UPF0716 protein FxsA
MGVLIPLLILGFPVAEAMAISKVAGEIGGWNTFFLLIFSGMFGAYLAKIQGHIVLERIQVCIREGRVPSHEMMDGLLVFLAGVLFVFPGFISDIFGLLLLFPLTRWLIRSLFLTGVKGDQQRRSQRQSLRPEQSAVSSSFPRGNVEDAEIVE